jgi:hypothetical protein
MSVHCLVLRRPGSSLDCSTALSLIDSSCPVKLLDTAAILRVAFEVYPKVVHPADMEAFPTELTPNVLTNGMAENVTVSVGLHICHKAGETYIAKWRLRCSLRWNRDVQPGYSQGNLGED